MSKIATQAFKSEDVILLNGDTVTVKSLSISKLRRFMKEWKKMGEAGTENGEWSEDDSFNIFVQCSAICLEDAVEGYVSPVKTKNKEFTASYLEYLEDNLEMETIYKIIEVAAGMKLSDPDLLKEVLDKVEKMETEESDGTSTTS